jgi:hypothetical protein
LRAIGDVGAHGVHAQCATLCLSLVGGPRGADSSICTRVRMCAKCTPRLHKDEKEEARRGEKFGKREKENGKRSPCGTFRSPHDEGGLRAV